METKKIDPTLRLARLYFERGDIIECIRLLETHQESLQLSDDNNFLECANFLLRAYAELMDAQKINLLIVKLNEWSRQRGELQPRNYYTLALCESHLGHHEKALDFCRKSLDLALKKNDKEDICYAITGLAISYYQLGRLQEALREIYNLQIFFESMELPQLQLTAQIINGHIFRKMGKFPQALDVLWQCYDMIKNEKNLYAYLSLLYGLGLTYKESGELAKARTYLELAMRSTDKNNLRRLHLLVDELLGEVVKSSQSPYDMIYDVHSHSVIEKTKGKIDFKNQFILLEMLKLFLAHPGRIFSKEEFIEAIWKQSYNPSVHDNKIYVTIKRLRKVIEPDYNQPKYLFLAKNGYYFTRDVKIQIRGHEAPMREERI